MEAVLLYSVVSTPLNHQPVAERWLVAKPNQAKATEDEIRLDPIICC